LSHRYLLHLNILVTKTGGYSNHEKLIMPCAGAATATRSAPTLDVGRGLRGTPVSWNNEKLAAVTEPNIANEEK
jgi:hypothetical protein